MAGRDADPLAGRYWKIVNAGPVMPVHPIGFKLAPAGFFVGNPALDNPQPGGSHCHHR